MVLLQSTYFIPHNPLYIHSWKSSEVQRLLPLLWWPSFSLLAYRVYTFQSGTSCGPGGWLQTVVVGCRLGESPVREWGVFRYAALKNEKLPAQWAFAISKLSQSWLKSYHAQTSLPGRYVAIIKTKSSQTYKYICTHIVLKFVKMFKFSETRIVPVTALSSIVPCHCHYHILILKPHSDYTT